MQYSTIFTLNFREFLHTMYIYVLNSVVKISMMFSQFFNDTPLYLGMVRFCGHDELCTKISNVESLTLLLLHERITKRSFFKKISERILASTCKSKSSSVPTLVSRSWRSARFRSWSSSVRRLCMHSVWVAGAMRLCCVVLQVILMRIVACLHNSAVTSQPIT